MKAIVYAAGSGTRLGPAYAGVQKLMLRFGGRTLLDWHALRLREAGAVELVVVTGHRRELIAAELPSIASRYGMTVRERVNPDHEAGSVLSVAASLQDIERAADDALLLLDGDVLYPRGFLEKLLQSAHPSALLVDRQFDTGDDDPVLVPMRDGHPFELRKRWKGVADSVGESVGLFKLGAVDRPALVAATRARTSGVRRTESYDEILRELVIAGRFGAEDVTGEPWTEIDFPADVHRAEQEVMPAILVHDEVGVCTPAPLR